ncbi:Zeta-crystallin [Orbilia brochopaga]|nr:Zeta-crystallin [Drechslerella brochopaga]
MPVAGPGEVIIRNHAIAINPVNWAIQAMEVFPVSYPFIGGNDAAGEIVEVGSSVDGFEVGDRVLALAEGDGSQEHKSNAAFQLFFSAKVCRIAKVPSQTSYAEAAVFPLTMATAASALFQKDTHALPLPQVDPVPQHKVILVWGGSSSVGACAIQLLVAAGFEVATTASDHNLTAMKEIGAKYVFDQKKENVAEDIVQQLGGKESAGVFCAILQADVIKLCGHIADRLGGNEFVSTVLPPTMPKQDGMPPGVETCNGKAPKTSLPTNPSSRSE